MSVSPLQPADIAAAAAAKKAAAGAKKPASAAPASARPATASTPAATPRKSAPPATASKAAAKDSAKPAAKDAKDAAPKRPGTAPAGGKRPTSAATAKKSDAASTASPRRSTGPAAKAAPAAGAAKAGAKKTPDAGAKKAGPKAAATAKAKAAASPKTASPPPPAEQPAPAPTEVAPADAAPVNAVPAEAAPTETAPAETVPAEAVPTEAALTEAALTEAAPADAAPAEATEETPVESEPVNQLIDLEPKGVIGTAPEENAAVEPLAGTGDNAAVDGVAAEGLPAPPKPQTPLSGSQDSLNSQDSIKNVMDGGDPQAALAGASMTDSLYLRQNAAAAAVDGAPFDPVASWGAPQGLPAPPPSAKRQSVGPGKAGAGGKKGEAKAPSYGPVVPCFVDLAYIPSHGDHRMADVEFFKRVRAQYYVLSSADPSPLLLDGLLEGKEAWEGDGPESTTLIPTYDNDTVLAWMARKKERLEAAKVVLAPSAHRCTIQLQDHQDAVCTAYRVEF